LPFGALMTQFICTIKFDLIPSYRMLQYGDSATLNQRNES